MLRVIVESASGIPKKKIGNPDPIVGIVFRGETIAFTVVFFSGETAVCSVNSSRLIMHSVSLSIIFSLILYFLNISFAVKCIYS